MEPNKIRTPIKWIREAGNNQPTRFWHPTIWPNKTNTSVCQFRMHDNNFNPRNTIEECTPNKKPDSNEKCTSWMAGDDTWRRNRHSQTPSGSKKKAQICPQLAHTPSVSMKTLVNAGCTVTFTKYKCILQYEGKTAWQGQREASTGLWILLLSPEGPDKIEKLKILPQR